jgi:hypothetical protein
VRQLFGIFSQAPPGEGKAKDGMNQREDRKSLFD